MEDRKVDFHGPVGQVVFGGLKAKLNQITGSDEGEVACQTCSKLRTINRKLWATVAAMCVVLAGMLPLLAKNVIWMPAHAEAKPEVCYLNGISHSVGTVTKMPDGEYRKCFHYADKPHAQWEPTVKTIDMP